MSWGKFFQFLFIAYLFYYVIVILIDVAKSSSNPKLANDEGEAMDITGVDEDHIVNNVDQFTENQVGLEAKTIPDAQSHTEQSTTIKNTTLEKEQISNALTETKQEIKSEPEPGAKLEPESALNEDEKIAMAGIQQSTISKGMGIKQLGDAYKLGAIEALRGIF